MRPLAVYPICLFLFFSGFALAQFNVQITVNAGSSTTTCVDNIGSPDPQWSVNIGNQGWVTYPSNIFCYNDFPNLQFDETYLCIGDIPPTIQVCFRAFENDPALLDPCTEVTSCLTETCMDVPVPPFGSTAFDIILPTGQTSAGQANLTIATAGIPGGVNDLPCQAIDFGVLQNNTSIGLLDSSIFNNFCSSNIGEPNPFTINGSFFNNQQGVWFKFTSNSDPKTLVRIAAKSDPSNFGDPIDLELGVFSTSTGTCAGPFTFFHSIYNATTFDETIYLRCPQPDRDYYILVDGKGTTPGQVEGYFSLELTELDIEAAGDTRCQATPLGLVPLGGAVGTPEPMSNNCATGAGDPTATAFGVQAGVFFTFLAPPTGHVLIEGISDTADDPISLQLGAYSSSNDLCSGIFTELASVTDGATLDESLELSCLDPGRIYYILVDGALNDLNQGVFTLSVTDAGNETPQTVQDVTICFGETLLVGNVPHNQSGFFEDTLQLASGCDSIVITTLTVLTDIAINAAVEQQGLNIGNTNGEVSTSPTGGAGGYSVLWSDGQTTNLATNLVGGDNYCVTVTDLNGCMNDTCFIMPYFENFITQFSTEPVVCNGESNGSIAFTAELGEPPYLYDWQNSNSSMSGSGTILADGLMATLENLPADVYQIHISDANYDTTLLVTVVEPDEISIANSNVVDASCFANCDGQISVTVAGGVPPYQANWSNGSTGQNLSGLCAAGYNLTVTDANGCTGIFNYEVVQPAEFIANAVELNPVSCFQGNDGEASVSTNGTPASYTWSNAATTPTISGLAGGIYNVTVTNNDGCTSTASVQIATPAEPLAVSLSVLQPVICFGENNGSLAAVVSGPGSSLAYAWSNGANLPTAQNLAAGNYSVTVTSEFGCSAEASLMLTEPAEIMLDFTTNALTCNDAPNGGIVTIETISGGIGPYQYSSNGVAFSDGPAIIGFTAGTQSFYVQDAIGCVRQFQATIDGPQEIILDLGNDLTIELGDVVRLEAQSNITNLEYQWSPSEGMNCPNCAETEVQPISETLYSLTVTDEFDCTKTADIYVEVLKKRKVFIPNAFSPNGDGINDEFVPFGGKDVVQILDFQVFDRQGNQVFTAQNFPAGDLVFGWNGFFKGKMMQAGVFAWFANIQFLDGEVELYKGDVSLVR